VHHGTINQGHYIAYVNREGTWYNFNDEYFSIVTEKEALSQEAYLMFYKQRE
jgi:ubiquitin C-terminal hydrolase